MVGFFFYRKDVGTTLKILHYLLNIISIPAQLWHCFDVFPTCRKIGPFFYSNSWIQLGIIFGFGNRKKTDWWPCKMLFPSPILLVPHVDVTMAVAWVLLHSMHCTYVFKRCPNGFRYIGITLDSITAMPGFDQTKQNTLYVLKFRKFEKKFSA